ncbi:bL17 family ribosomal protein [Patescibacteria group bacterium]|nr:bL17 family ribosomal protein [Patescibacteria group bacterium]
MLKRNLITSLLLYESVRTTRKRAKVITPIIDRLITVAKTRPSQIAIRFINRTVTDKNASRKVMQVYKERYNNRSSGITRIIAVGARKGDGAELVDLSLVDGVAGSDLGLRTSDLGGDVKNTSKKSNPNPEPRSPSKTDSKPENKS